MGGVRQIVTPIKISLKIKLHKSLFFLSVIAGNIGITHNIFTLDPMVYIKDSFRSDRVYLYLKELTKMLSMFISV